MIKKIMKYVAMATIVLGLFVSTATAADTTTPVVKPAPVPVASNSNFTAASTLRGWEMTVGGFGRTSVQNMAADWQWGGEFSLAKEINLDLGKVFTTDLGLRQSIGYGKIGEEAWSTTIGPGPCEVGGESTTTSGVSNKDGWVFRTEMFWDINIPLYKRLSMFVGPNLGVNYGECGTPSWSIGPEAGFKYDLSHNVFLYTRANYDWCFTDNSPDAFRLGAGVGFRF